MISRSLTHVVASAAIAAAIVGCQRGSETPDEDCSKLPVAPESARVDLVEPSFSNPLSVTNPLFPISHLHSAVLLGNENGVPLRVETTLLPNPKSITWKGQQIRTNESQYVAFLNGRLHEVAIDWYGQADDGSVWYFGEDVFNYENGAIADREGTWLAGRDAPLAMIMPANPRAGDVFRPENVCGVVFEEVTVKAVGVTVNGPRGPVPGAIVTDELHMDGTREDKTFAPGYGEFSTGSGANLEAIALAVPTDALSGAPPATLNTLISGASTIFDAAQANDWPRASATMGMMVSAWNSYRAGTPPPMLAAQMATAMGGLTSAVDGRSVAGARHAAINVARAGLDFLLRYRPPAQIDRARFDLWAAQILVDAAANDAPAVLGDATTLEWGLQRFAHTLSNTVRAQVEAILRELRTAADARNMTAAASAASRLRAAVAM